MTVPPPIQLITTAQDWSSWPLLGIVFACVLADDQLRRGRHGQLFLTASKGKPRGGGGVVSAMFPVTLMFQLLECAPLARNIGT